MERTYYEWKGDEKYLFDTSDAGWLECLHGRGFVVLRGVLDESECDALQQGLDSHFEKLVPGFCASDATTYRLLNKTLLPSHGMLHQFFGIGQNQALWDVRQNPRVASVFARIWSVPVGDLLTSMDGCGYMCPPAVTGLGLHRKDWLHFDQRLSDNTRQCIQGWVTAQDVDADAGDATLQVLEGSHLVRGRLPGVDHSQQRTDWYKLSAEQVHYLGEHGCSVRYISCPRGSLVLWDSRLAHAGRGALRGSTRGRCVAYVCMQPRYGVSKRQLEKRVSALLNRRTTSHWPLKAKLFGKYPRTYGAALPTHLDKDGFVDLVPKPQLTSLGISLLGSTF